jgi:hypothetical protein
MRTYETGCMREAWTRSHSKSVRRDDGYLFLVWRPEHHLQQCWSPLEPRDAGVAAFRRAPLSPSSSSFNPRVGRSRSSEVEDLLNIGCRGSRPREPGAQTVQAADATLAPKGARGVRITSGKARDKCDAIYPNHRLPTRRRTLLQAAVHCEYEDWPGNDKLLLNQASKSRRTIDCRQTCSSLNRRPCLFEEFSQLVPLRLCQYHYRCIARRTKAVSLFIAFLRETFVRVGVPRIPVHFTWINS